MKTKRIVDVSKVFDSTIRIQMLASLSTSSLTYNQLKQVCQVKDGVMTFHTTKLFEADYISIDKTFVDNKPLTTYSITPLGKEAFLNFVSVLNQSVESIQ